VPCYTTAMKLIDAAAQLEALGNPTRLGIYRLLVKVGEGGLPVGKLQSRLGAAASTLTHHLQKLIQVKLVTQERQATTLICRANYPVMNDLVGFLTEECCVEEKSCRSNAA
jgi:ArsR family transcriptional regulator